jgi:SAM-dependent methyltransferase
MSDVIGDKRYDWRPYYKISAERPPRELLHKTLKRFDRPGYAVDLGCGMGVDGRLMLATGWRVLAIDQQEMAIETVRAMVPPEDAGRLETMASPYKSLSLPEADLVWAGLALPFCHPWDFKALWDEIRESLAAGGRFAGDFFGPRHVWAGSEKMTFHSKEEVLALCEGLELEYMVEEEGEVRTADQGNQHWHQFSVCVRREKPSKGSLSPSTKTIASP